MTEYRTAPSYDKWVASFLTGVLATNTRALRSHAVTITRKMHRFALCLALLVAALSGCDSNGPDEEEEIGKIVLTLSGLDPLSNGFHLEGWIVTAEAETRSVGKFNVDERGNLVDLDGNAITANLIETPFELDSTVHRMLISIEPPGDTDDTPSDTRLLGGIFVEQTAELKAADVEGIEDALILSAGTFIVATPTDGPNTNEESGIWFVNLTGGPPGRGLRTTIPIRGWKYQAWTEFDGIIVDMGVITHHSRPDESSLYSGTLPGYNYPGEDFLTNAPPGLDFPISVISAVVFVTLEPNPDPDPTPSQFVLFSGRVPENVQANETYNLANLIERFPSGSAFISN